MSYSFTVKAATKAEVLAAVAVEMDKVIASQPVHAADKDLVLAHAATVVGFLPDDPSRDISVGCNGYLSWTAQPAEEHISGVSVNCGANLVAKAT